MNCLKNFWKYNKQLLPGSWLLYTTAYNSKLGTSLEIQWLSAPLPMQGVLVWSLVGELRFPQASCPTPQKKQNRNNRSKIVANSVKTLKMVHIKKKKKIWKRNESPGLEWREGVCVCVCVCVCVRQTQQDLKMSGNEIRHVLMMTFQHTSHTLFEQWTCWRQ